MEKTDPEKILKPFGPALSGWDNAMNCVVFEVWRCLSGTGRLERVEGVENYLMNAYIMRIIGGIPQTRSRQRIHNKCNEFKAFGVQKINPYLEQSSFSDVWLFTLSSVVS